MTDALALVDEWGPEKVVVVSHRRTGMRGVLVIDNTARGAGKGGTRMSPTVTVGEVARLARNMTWKWAAVDLFYGGAKAGIVADPTAPDFLANAGGVVAAAYAMDSRYSGFRPDSGTILEPVSARLRANTTDVLGQAERAGCTPHAAGRARAQDRVLAAMRSKGRLPAGC